MIEIGAYEAKTKLAELLRRVENEGEEIFITRNGKRVAKLVPLDENIDIEEIIKQVKKLKKGLKITREEIKEMIATGRK